MANEEFQKLVLEELSNIKGQLSETSDIVKALMHHTEELDAKMDGLAINTASKEVIERFETKLDKIIATQTIQGESVNILAMRQLYMESEIEALKKAK